MPPNTIFQIFSIWNRCLPCDRTPHHIDCVVFTLFPLPFSLAKHLLIQHQVQDSSFPPKSPFSTEKPELKNSNVCICLAETHTDFQIVCFPLQTSHFPTSQKKNPERKRETPSREGHDERLHGIKTVCVPEIIHLERKIYTGPELK